MTKINKWRFTERPVLVLVSKNCNLLWNQRWNKKRYTLCTVWNSKFVTQREIQSVMIQVHAHASKSTCLQCNHRSAIQLKSIHGLNTVFGAGRHPLPFHSQIQPQETGHYTLSLLASCASWITGKGRMTWGHNELQMLLGTLYCPGKVMHSDLTSHSGYLQTATPRNQSHTGQFIQQLAWRRLQRGAKWKMCCESPHLHGGKIITASPVIYYLCRHKH